MKKNKILNLIFGTILFLANDLNAQIGYYDVPYVRYEADLGILTNATIIAKSNAQAYAQTNLQSEASDQVCVNLSSAGASVEWTVSAAGDGLVVRYSVPDGQSGVLGVYADNILVDTLNLTSYYSWEYLSSNGNPNNAGVVNTNPRMRFDEVRMKLPSRILAGGSLKLVNRSGPITIDFAELDSVPASISSSLGDIVYGGNGSDLQAVINANGGKTIYLPPGAYNVPGELYFGINSTVLKGAGMWYTEIHFTGDGISQPGGLRANASNISYSGLYLTTVRNSRSNSYKAINGVYTSGSTITNIWTEHFECGAWIAQFNTGGPSIADGFTMSYCRFRNNYADGTNLSKGTSNAIVEHCSYRNNGDDDMAIWSSGGLECQNNTFRYNTSENCWRSAGCAIYGGYNNQAQHLLIKDNLEVGLRVNNSFTGVGFNDNGMHGFSDITIIGCGTFNDLYNNPVGAIDIACTNVAGTRVKNVRFYNITITDSKNDAIYMYKKSGEGFYNLIFRNITVNGTGREYPYNDAKNLTTWGRGYGILFVGSPSGYGTYCNLTYTNRGGNATVNINNAQIGTFSWTLDCSPPSTIAITSSTSFGICTNPVTLTATATPPSGDALSYAEFFVDNVSIGTGHDNADTSGITWNNHTVGSHQIKAVAHYLPSNTTSASSVQYITVADGIYTTATAPIIDGSIDALWNNYPAFSINKVSIGAANITGPADLSANFKVARDASYLYILVNVTDDILRSGNTARWQNDEVELFIDMGNTKSATYGANDFTYNFVYNVSTVYENAHNATTGVVFAQGLPAGGYIMEIKIPWATLGGTPSAGSFIGFDIGVDDNDTGVRDSKIDWSDITDNAWQWPSVLGTLQIANCSNPVLAIDPVTFTNEVLNFYPNPFHVSGNLQINSGNADNYSISIKDMTGRVVGNTNLTGSGPYSIGGSLSPGMYILEVFDGITRQTIKLIKL